MAHAIFMYLHVYGLYGHVNVIKHIKHSKKTEYQHDKLADLPDIWNLVSACMNGSKLHMMTWWCKVEARICTV